MEVEAVRADRFPEPGLITDQMIAAILNHDLCVAVLAGHNPNVFYELALVDRLRGGVVID